MSESSPVRYTLTGRVFISPPTEDDDVHVSALRSHPETHRYLSGVIPDQCSVEDARRLREDRAANPLTKDFNVHVTINDAPRFAGMTGVFKMDTQHQSCEVGILVCPELHGKGIATEALYLVLKFAFEEIRMHRVSAVTSCDNLPMRSWFEKVAGATMEGRTRDGWMSGPGQWVDVANYGMLEDEWRDSIKPKLEAIILGRGSST